MTKYIGFFFIPLFLFACQSNVFDQMLRNDQELHKPQPGEWRFEHKENSQSLHDFRQSYFIRPDSKRKNIDLIPIGTFTLNEAQQLSLCCEYLSIFFQIPCRLSKVISDSAIPTKNRRIGTDHQIQFLAPFILDSVLLPQLDSHAFCSMSITTQDLFPKPEWNYVFGLASFTNRVSVSSIYRFRDQPALNQIDNVCLLRLLKTASHETGHMVGLHHCQHARCVMNGSNSLQELDQIFCRLCSDCLQKLNSNIPLKIEARNIQLLQFFRKNHLETPIQELIPDSIAFAN